MKEHLFEIDWGHGHRFSGRDRHGGGHRGFRDRMFEMRGEFGFGGGGRERLFNAGDVKLVLLRLLSEQPSYGYQLMKSMEERLGGGYTPSAGAIYPTLTMLEEEGLITAGQSEGTKKIFSVTEDGLAYLAEHRDAVDELFERLDRAGDGFRRGRSPEIHSAFHNLGHAVMARMVRGNATPEQIRKIVEVINAAAKAVDEL